MIKLKAFFKHNWKFIVFSLGVTILFTYPYLVRDFLGMEHDTFFHISRIEGLATSFKDGIYVPRIYPYKNANFGYGNPMFYSEFFLVIPALLYNLGLNLASCYKLIIIVATILSCYFMMKLITNLTKNLYAPYLAGFLYIFSNYRITDVYVRGALGEVLAFIFLPICLIGIINVLYKDENKWWILAVGFAGLILSHNLTFVLACIMFFILILCYLKTLFADKKRILAILKAVGVVILITAFYTFPLIEQSNADYFIFESYSQGASSLQEYAVNTWQYFANNTIFGMGSNTYDYQGAMLISLGLFTMLAPLCYFFILDKKKDNPDNRFIFIAMIVGYCFMFACSKILPWSSLQGILGFIQFPWRLEGIALPLLVIPASIYSMSLFKKENIYVFGIVMTLLIFEATWHIEPVMNRGFGITSQTTQEDIATGKVMDPYYSANYVRIDCAGGDYFPVGYTDFLTLSKCVTGVNNAPLSCEINKVSTTSSVVIDNYTGQATFPITWYRGYQVYYQENDGSLSKVNTYKSATSLVGFDVDQDGTYICKYDDTVIQTASLWLSIISALGIIGYTIFKKTKNKK